MRKLFLNPLMYFYSSLAILPLALVAIAFSQTADTAFWGAIVSSVQNAKSDPELEILLATSKTVRHIALGLVGVNIPLVLAGLFTQRMMMKRVSQQDNRPAPV